MNIQNLISTLLLCCLATFSFAQHQSSLTKGTIPEEHLERMNEDLPPHLKISATGQLIQTPSRNQVSLWDSTNQYGWNMNNMSWFLDFRTKAVTYDSQGFLLEGATTYLPNPITGSSGLNKRTIFNYTSSGLRNSTIELTLNGTTWDTSSIYNYQYNNGGYITSRESISKTTYNGQPVTNISLEQYTYDSNNNLLSYDFYEDYIFTNGLEYQEREEFTYDNNNNRVSRIRYSNRDVVNNTWGTVVMDSTFYDTNNYISSKIFYDGNGNKSSRVTYLVNNDGYILESTHKQWSSSSQTWVNGSGSSKVTSTYNTNNELIKILYQGWDGNQWVNSIEKSYILTSFGETDVATFKRWGNNLWYRDAKTEVDYNNDEDITRWEYLSYNQDSTIVGGFYYERFYSLHTVNTANVLEKNLNVYPNPTTEMIYLDLPDDLNNAVINIWDLQGRLVHQENYSQNRINLANLTKGIYILKVKGQDVHYTTKIIKE